MCIIDVTSLSDHYEFTEEISITGGAIDSDLSANLQATFLRSTGVNEVSTVVIENSIEAQDLAFLSVFAQVDSVTIYSTSLQSLKGLDKLKKLDFLIVHMDGSRQPDLSILQDRSLKFLKVTGVNQEVVEMISTLKINDLSLLKLKPGISFAALSSCMIESLLASESHMTCLNGLEKIVSCKMLALYALQKLTTLTNFPPNLEVLTVQACNKLEFGELLGSLSCRHLEIVSCKCPVDLTRVFGVRNLKAFQVTGTPVRFSGDLPECANVERALIDNLTSKQRKEINKRYPNLELL